MSYESAVAALLAADSTFNTPLTGGVHTYASTGRKGLNRVSVPAAFNTTTGLLKPTCIVKERNTNPWGGLTDESTKYASERTIVEIWIYNDGDAGYSVIETARDRAYALLANEQVPGSFQLLYDTLVKNQKDPSLNDAAYNRIDFAVIGHQSS